MNLLRTILVTLVSQIFLIRATELDPSQISKCTLSCLLETFPAANCTFTDPTCQCQNQALLLATSECMVNRCSLADLLTLGKLREKLCNIAPESRQRRMFIVNVTTATISIVTVSLRFLSRFLVCKRIWLDDAIILSATLLNLALGTIAGWMQFNGLGKHIWDISITKIPKILLLFYVDESLYLAVILLTKVSLLSFYLRIFPRRGFQNVTKVVLVFVICSGVIILFLQIFQCLPVAYNWDKSIPNGSCLSVNTLTYTHAAMSILQDVIILVLPVSELASLKLERKQKLGVFFVFQVGAFACITAMIRLRYLTQFGGTKSFDPTWDDVNATIWTAIEVNTGIVCSCIPAVRALLKCKFPARLKSMGTSSSVFTSVRKQLSIPSSGASNHGKMIHTQPKKPSEESANAVVQGDYLDKPLPPTPSFLNFGNASKTYYDGSY